MKQHINLQYKWNMYFFSVTQYTGNDVELLVLHLLTDRIS